MIARLIYSFLCYLIVPFEIARLLWRSFREPDYSATLLQRFGFVSTIDTDPIWVHAVSAGEAIAAVPLIKRLQSHGHQVLVTTMTPTGRERFLSLLGDEVIHSYVPYDLPDVIQRFLRATHPKAFIIIDTELWPNIIHYVHANNIPSFLVNARLSPNPPPRAGDSES